VETHLKASLGVIEKKDDMLARLRASLPEPPASGAEQSEAAEG
jgi:hypothetical protein